MDGPIVDRPRLMVAKTDARIRHEAIEQLLAMGWVRQHEAHFDGLEWARDSEDDFDACITAAALRAASRGPSLQPAARRVQPGREGILVQGSVNLALPEATFRPSRQALLLAISRPKAGASLTHQLAARSRFRVRSGLPEGLRGLAWRVGWPRGSSSCAPDMANRGAGFQRSGDACSSSSFHGFSKSEQMGSTLEIMSDLTYPLWYELARQAVGLAARRGQDATLQPRGSRRGWLLLRRLQRGEPLGLPASRPMPGIGPGCNELRIGERYQTWRIVYHVADDAMVVSRYSARRPPRRPGP